LTGSGRKMIFFKRHTTLKTVPNLLNKLCGGVKRLMLGKRSPWLHGAVIKIVTMRKERHAGVM